MTLSGPVGPLARMVGMAVLAAGLIGAPQRTAADTLRSEGGAGCIVVAPDQPAGVHDADLDVRITADCNAAMATSWTVQRDAIAPIGIKIGAARMCLTVDFRRSLDGKGGTFNVFAAADCDKALFWEVRDGFVSAEIASTVYCLEVSDDPQTPSNVMARIGCSGDDNGIWLVE